MMKIRRGTLFQAIISTAILIGLFRLVDLKLLLATLRQVNGLLLTVALLIVPFAIWIRSVRWQLILNKDDLRVSLREAFLLMNVGAALDMIVPGGAGDLVKSYYGYKRLGIREEMFSSALIDRFIAFLVLFLLGAFSAFSYHFYLFSAFSLLSALAISFPLFFPDLVPWRLINRLWVALRGESLDIERLAHSSCLSSTLLMTTLLLSFLGWGVTYLQLFILCLAFQADVDLLYAFLIAPMFSLARLLPFTLNGLGAQESVITYLFSLVGLPATSAILVSFANRVINYAMPGLIGFWAINTLTPSLPLEKREGEGREDKGKDINVSH
ncbi:MAG: flippase-like domain-containing protein [Candidatus Tectomicrobia bacterium]|nr:flippase-like domain-containing protein [Candidatus Tectomicrobia bacterium]